MENNQCLITTFDNPFDPFEQFTSWFLFDVEKGYYTCSKIARIVEQYSSEDLSQKETEELNEMAIDILVTNDFLHIYKKVYRNSVPTN